VIGASGGVATGWWCGDSGIVRAGLVGRCTTIFQDGGVCVDMCIVGWGSIVDGDLV
jgi:hypothetical protein